MATPLRYTLISLLWCMMAAIYSPLVPGAFALIIPALSIKHWLALFADPQLSQALLATLISATIAAVGALTIALTVIVALWPGARWLRLCARLPWLLAIPHVAFATSALLLFAEGGWLYRTMPFFSPLLDRYGIGLGVTLAVKESAFILWILAALLSEKQLSQQVIVLDTLGYSRLQCLNWLLLPSVAPALGAVMLAVVAWSLSVVDVAIILGPGNPPTLAVLSWQWLSQGDSDQQIKGALVSFLLVGLLVAFALTGYLLWRAWQRTLPTMNGVRRRRSSTRPGQTLSLMLPLTGVLCSVLLALIAHPASVNLEALFNSLSLGLAASAIGLIMILLWLEWGPSRGHGWLWLPIVLPALPLVSGQYILALRLELDGQYATVIWGHLLWVIPWMLFALRPAWQRIDPRLILVAQTLGWTKGKIFCCVKCPLLVRPALLAFSVGFSVSIAQYMPGLWLGAGRYPTLTTEAVALSSGGNNAILAKHGIRHDTTVVLYGRDVYAAARVAQIMLYAGVKDVRVLDGGWQSWSDSGLPVERGTPPKVKAEPDFGVAIPAQPQLMLNMEQARALLHRQDASLVSIRSWPEFIGTTSGYNYIKPKGEIAGARWGHAGSDSTHMEDFHNPDGTMRSADDIAAMWKQWNILADQQVSFYCGTGWRASETFIYARAMGWKNVSVYDGGWYEWSRDPKNPVATGERGPDSSL